jgi:hypothetical protein
MVRVNGEWWLLCKTDGDAVGQPTTFLSQRIGRDGLPYGPRFTLLTADQGWESGTIEAPNLIQNPGTGQWWLVFSAGNFDPGRPTYGIVTAPCDGPQGPCHIESVIHLVSRNFQGAAPGEEYAFVDPTGQIWIAYNPGGPFDPPNLRPLALVKLEFDTQGQPYVVTP